MGCRVAFFSGTAVYLIAFFGYVMSKMAVEAAIILAVAGAFLMLGSILYALISPAPKSARQSADYSYMIRCFFLVACLVVVHALAENALAWQSTKPSNQAKDTVPTNNLELW